MTQPKTIKEKAIEEGTKEALNFIKSNMSFSSGFYEGDMEDIVIKSLDLSSKKSVDTYADEVKKVIDEFEQYHFGDESEHPSMTIHYSDLKDLKKRLGLK